MSILKKLIAETVSKYSASLPEIMENTDELGQVLGSRDFMVNLANDLINMRNISQWKLDLGNTEDHRNDSSEEGGSFEIRYEFDFVYNYNNNGKSIQIPLVLMLEGQMPFDVDKYDGGNYFNAPSGGGMKMDYQNAPASLDLSLWHEGTEIPFARNLQGKEWMTPQIKQRIIQNLVKYVK